MTAEPIDRTLIAYPRPMVTLQIEHAITDYPTWRGAFDRFAEARERAGVRGHRIRRRVDGHHYLVIELDFDTTAQAEDFLAFLRSTVWASSTNAPALVGAPEARILEAADGD